MSELEEMLLTYLRLMKTSEPICEHRFHPPRRWQFDLAWPHKKVACEIEGATWSNGRHTRGGGFEKDCEKYNIAAIDGWCVLRVTGAMVRDGRAIDFIEQALATSQ